jgi:hypothetical protein
MLSDESKKIYKEKIKKIAEELAQEIIRNETDLDKRYRSLDSDVQDILIDIGNSTLQIIGESAESDIKKSLKRRLNCTEIFLANIYMKLHKLCL